MATREAVHSHSLVMQGILRRFLDANTAEPAGVRSVAINAAMRTAESVLNMIEAEQEAIERGATNKAIRAAILGSCDRHMDGGPTLPCLIASATPAQLIVLVEVFCPGE